MLDFAVHPEAQASINSLAQDALACVQKIDVPAQRGQAQHWWLPKETPTITDKDVIGSPLMWLPQQDGGRAFVFLYQGNECFGLNAANHKQLEKLTSAVLKLKWAKKALSEEYIRDAFVEWVRARYLHKSPAEFLGHLIDACRKDVIEQTVWAPVQHLAVETPFVFGETRVFPMDTSIFDQMREVAVRGNPESVASVDKFLADFKRKMSGCAAIEVKITAEPRYAQQAAQQVCDDAVGLLRFFCAATCTSQWMSPVSLLGALNVPQVHLLAGHPTDGMAYTTGGKFDLVDYWRLSRKDVELLMQEDLNDVGGLIYEEALNEYGRAVRSSILAYSRAVTFADLSDRLVFAFSAIEGLMLRDANEAIQQNVGERVAFLISTVPSERQQIVENFRKAYRMRSQYIHHRVSSIDVEELDRAFLNIRAALSCAVANLGKFTSHQAFIEALELRKFGG